ncbi:MAG: hypothetical protein A2461_00295 [Burkholderiales bacterium RIFOXYC2_FULL_59_8]|nr:MAG: hypothetical protein A2461_00295 [Burkholderiales bacterium RIFOXYC2_FULL_59_8]
MTDAVCQLLQPITPASIFGCNVVVGRPYQFDIHRMAPQTAAFPGQCLVCKAATRTPPGSCQQQDF